jgi:hypothetical protein
MRSNFVVVELEIPADVHPGSEMSQRTMPLSLEEALPGSRTARLGVPKGVFILVYVDEGHQYIVRVWHGADATNTIWRSRTGLRP